MIEYNSEKVKSKSPSAYHTLKNGDQVTVINTGEVNELAMVDPESVTAWMTQRLVFESTTLETVIKEINRYNHAKITLNTPQLKMKKISDVFSTHDPKVLLDFLSKVGGVIVEAKEKQAGWNLSLPNKS